MTWKFSEDYYTHRIFPWCVFLVSCFSSCTNSVLWWQRAWHRKWRKWCGDFIDKNQFTTSSNQLHFVVFGNIDSNSHIRILKIWYIWSRSWVSLIYAQRNTEYSVFRFPHTDAESWNTRPPFAVLQPTVLASLPLRVLYSQMLHTFYFDIPESEKSLFMLLKK